MPIQYPKQVEKNDPKDFGERWEIRENSFVNGVHLRADCVPPCPLHHPSEHSMDDAPLLWRDDRFIFERLCEHGVGHPDPDTLDHVANERGDDAAYWESVHGCDGCCYDPDRKARREPDSPPVEKAKPAPSISLEAEDQDIGLDEDDYRDVILAVVQGAYPDPIDEATVEKVVTNFAVSYELAQITLTILDLIRMHKVVLTDDGDDPEGWKVKAQDWVMPE